MSELIICDTPDKIRAFRLLTLKAMLGLELIGMKRSGKRESALSIIKREFGLRGSKQVVYDKYIELLKREKILVPAG